MKTVSKVGRGRAVDHKAGYHNARISALMISSRIFALERTTILITGRVGLGVEWGMGLKPVLFAKPGSNLTWLHVRQMKTRTTSAFMQSDQSLRRAHCW